MTLFPQQTHASAPVMAMPKAESKDPVEEAMNEHNRIMAQKQQAELKAFSAKCREIEAKKGEAARVQYEREYKESKLKEAEQLEKDLVQLKYDLLDKGIDPFVDLEGKRQVFLMDKGVDLAEVRGTQFEVEVELERKGSNKAFSVQKQANREMIKCMVEDMKNRDIDPLEYFERHQDKTADILSLPPQRAMALAQQYRANIDQYGSILPPKEGEMSVKEKMAKKSPNAAKAEARRLRKEAKVKAKEEKAAARAKAKEEKAKAKEEAAAAKKAMKAAAAAAAAAGASAAASTAQGAASVAGDTLTGGPTTTANQVVGSQDVGSDSHVDNSATMTEAPKKSSNPSKTSSSSSLPVIPAAGAVVTVAAGGYAFKMYQEKSAADEEERQRQLRMLMGELEKDTSPASALEDIDTDMDDMMFDEEEHRNDANDKPVEPETPAPKKKRKGFKSVFGKKKNNRETDISVLVSDGAMAPDLAATLAKLLTFGAPGRFPEISGMPGGMPMQEFDLDAAREILVSLQEDAGISQEELAEVFANVVNCMLIDIVDLASASLKEKDSQVTVDAVNIVVDFMNHAGAIYDSILNGMIIVPVTYGGDLAKGKLEQLYSAYAVSGMTDFTNMDENFEGRVGLLADVFQISEKRAEGLMMKAMQKNMMEMMKSGKGMEGMEEMMKGMGGMEGMEGMEGLLGGADGEEPSPEQIKEMLKALKQLKDSGSIPAAEMEEVKNQFKEAFGSSIDEVMKDADASGESLTAEDAELLELMKDILED